MNILGLNAYHADASACLVIDGQLFAAAEEERFRRIKHWAGFPSEAIRYCLKEANLSLEQIDHIAINTDPKANLLRKIGFTLSQRPDPRFIIDRLQNKKKRLSIAAELTQAFPTNTFKGQIHTIEHHLSHLSSAFYVADFEDAVVASVDGFGDFSSGAWGIGKDHHIALKDYVYFPHSLGIFYQALTQYLGFPHYGDEYKIMGLAPYGEPKYMAAMHKIVKLTSNGQYRLDLQYFRHHKEKIPYTWDNGIPHIDDIFSPELENLLGAKRKKDEPLEQKHKDIARSVQAMYEEAFFHLINTIYKQFPMQNIALAGGCAMNSVANGKVLTHSDYKKVYVQSAAGDAGGAIGAAFVVSQKLAKPKQKFFMNHAYWGPHFSNQAIQDILASNQAKIAEQGCHLTEITDDDTLCQKTAEKIAEGKVIGWFQGRMEWGPRALGNRSIIGDPRRADMKDILNLKIKRRESFRPFAPSILREQTLAWFEIEDEVPFMMQVFQIREEKRKLLPAVTHVDGSGRLQTVYKDTNPLYYLLIEKFFTLTGVPMVLNTSFNENEPVVCQPQEALDCFLRTKMDILVIGNFFIERL